MFSDVQFAHWGSSSQHSVRKLDQYTLNMWKIDKWYGSRLIDSVFYCSQTPQWFMSLLFFSYDVTRLWVNSSYPRTLWARPSSDWPRWGPINTILSKRIHHKQSWLPLPRAFANRAALLSSITLKYRPFIHPRCNKYSLAHMTLLDIQPWAVTIAPRQDYA